MEIKYSDEPMH